MPKYSPKSQARLDTCHPLIIKVFNHVIIDGPDHSIVCGHRPVAEQQALYAQGRTKPGQIVTNVDGINDLSKHNPDPSEAADAIPYPTGYNSVPHFKIFGAYVLGVASAMGVPLFWGADWDRDWDMDEHKFIDLPHFELRL